LGLADQLMDRYAELNICMKVTVCAGVCESETWCRQGHCVWTRWACVCIQFSPSTKLYWLQNWSTWTWNVSFVCHQIDYCPTFYLQICYSVIAVLCPAYVSVWQRVTLMQWYVQFCVIQVQWWLT